MWHFAVLTVNLAFCSINNFLLETSLPNLVSLTRPSLQILDKTKPFPISRFLVNLLYTKIFITPDIGMKLGPGTKLEKRNTATSKKLDEDVVSVNFDVLVIFPIYGQFGVIVKLDSGRMVTLILTFLVTETFYLTKTENSKKSLAQLSHYCSE